MQKKFSFLALFFIFFISCSSSTPQNIQKPAAVIESPIKNIESSSRITPPGAMLIAWVDIKKLKNTLPYSDMEKFLKNSSSSLPSQEVFENLKTVSIAFYPASSGFEMLVIAHIDMDEDRTFEIVKEWSNRIGSTPVPKEIRRRRALEIKDNLFVKLGESIYASGSETLVAYCADLIDQKKTANSFSHSLSYLFKKSVKKDAMLIAYAKVPVIFSDWLEGKRLKSIAGGSLMLSVTNNSNIHLRLGILPGEDIKTIWFANEINTFLARASKNKRIIKLGIDKWVESLKTILLDRGVIVEGEIEKEKILQILNNLSN